MDYEALAQLIPVPPALWNHHHLSQWLSFIHLPALTVPFCTSLSTQNIIGSREPPLAHSLSSNLYSWELAVP